MPAPTLLSAATRACIRRVTTITDVGDYPYSLVRAILKRVQNPAQLHTIELASPQIADEDEELWRAFIARDIPDWKDKIIEPSNPRSWHKVYKKLMRAEQRLKDEQEKKLMAAMTGLSEQKQENQVGFISRVVQEKNPRARPAPTTLSKNARGNDALRTIKAQASQAVQRRRMDMGLPRKGVMSTAKPKQPMEMPKWMVDQYRKPEVRAPMAPVPAGLVPSYKTFSMAPNRETVAGRQLKQAESEARLKALTQKSRPIATPVSQRRPAESSLADREARLRALTQPKPKQGSPPVQKAVPAVATRPVQGTASSQPVPASSPQQHAAAINRASTASPVKRPSTPVPQQTRKRPAPSVLMPMKRRKV